MNRRSLLSILSALPVVGTVAACSSGRAPSSSTTPGDLLGAHGLAGRSPIEVVEALEANPAARPLALRASVKPDRVELSDGSASQVLTLPDDRFYLSIAPYGSRTHECFHHNLGTCQGELVDTQLSVRIVRDDGTVLVDATTKTHANGFVGFWLPRSITADLAVTGPGGRRAAQQITTGDDAPTCLTTLQLV